MILPIGQSNNPIEWKPEPLDDIEKRHILKTLDYFNGSKEKAAKSLGVTAKTLYNKLHRWGLMK